MVTTTRRALAPSVLFAVGVGAILGSGLRALATSVVPQPSLDASGLTALPHGLGLGADIWAVIAINLVGAYLLGVMTELFRARPTIPVWLVKGTTTGLLGSFTTLSALMSSWAVGVWALSSQYPEYFPTFMLTIAAMASGALTLAISAWAGTLLALLGMKNARSFGGTSGDES